MSWLLLFSNTIIDGYKKCNYCEEVICAKNVRPLTNHIELR